MALCAILDRSSKLPSFWEEFLISPPMAIARWAYAYCVSYSARRAETADSNASDSYIRVVCISDTHNAHSSLIVPPGDILIHSGDLTNSGTEEELHSVLSCILSSYPNLIYLERSSTALTVRGRRVRVYGSPCTPRHGSGVFQYPRSEADWSGIPPHTDILITHGPPAHHLDAGGRGCWALLQALWHVRPRLHVFGHCHDGYGTRVVNWSASQMAYERVCARRAGWKGVLQIIFALLHVLVFGRPRLKEGDSILANASFVGGMRDEIRRDAVVVEL
ncbi:Metallo-dependent phosphatase [Panus rudis PR-1116 ss-1]|nr:Metallo-dependent phosphatase [Panus rudis PR-1116 ss-1]